MVNTETNFSVSKVMADTWRFNEAIGSNPYVDAYLVVGSKRSVLVDSLQSKQPVSLAKQIREITDLPVDVLLTHGHPDHAGMEIEGFLADSSFTLHISHEDIGIVKTFFQQGFDLNVLHNINEGDSFDLGGIKITAYCVAGHTPGSMVFVDFDNRRCFTGDAFGVWLQLKHSLPMTVYVDELKRFEKTIAEYPDITFWGGHLSQAMGVTLTSSLATDMREACEMILAGNLIGEEMVFTSEAQSNPLARLMKGARIAKYKSVKYLTYKDSTLR